MIIATAMFSGMPALHAEEVPATTPASLSPATVTKGADGQPVPDTRPRLCVLTDIGGDPDDQQSLIRLLIYSNEFRLEGLLPTSSGTPGECHDASPRADLINSTIDAYALVLPNLRDHADRWPAPDALHALVHPGKAARGLAAIGGEVHDTDASRWLIQSIDSGTADDPLNITIWGGQTDLAQALWRVKSTRTPAELATFITRFRVYDIDDQDSLADHLRATYPGLRYILAKSNPGRDKRDGCYRGMYLGGDESLTGRAWINKNIVSTGPLGALYPLKTWTAPNPEGCLKEGDTPSWFFFLPTGGNKPDDPTVPGWGGQFVHAPDGWWIDIPVTKGDEARATVHSHRPIFQADFARRMAWCVKLEAK